MYNLQKAKEEIDAVANHTGVLTEHVLAVAERLHALEGDLGAKMERLKGFVATIEASFSHMRTAIGGGDFHTSAVSDLGAKIALLHNVVHGPAAHDRTSDTASHDIAPAPTRDIVSASAEHESHTGDSLGSHHDL